MRATAAVGATPFAPYHWLMYGRSMWFDIEHARSGLGWSPRWSVDEMFAQSYDWFLRHRDAIHDAGSSRHRRSARQGVLGAIKHAGRLLPSATGRS